MIVGIEGKPGSGKSYYSTRMIKEALKEGKKIYTNMENIQIRSMAFNIEKETKGGVSRYQVLNNFRILKTKDLRRFWEIPKSELANSLIILDEVMLDFFSRDWQKTGKDLIFFFTQHRKYKTDLYYITQSISKVDGVLREMTQYYIRLRNTVHYKSWFIPVPSMFVATWFYEDQETVVKREWIKPSEDIYKYYDSWAVFANDVIPNVETSIKPVFAVGRSKQGNIILFPGVTEEVRVTRHMSCRLPWCPDGDCTRGCLIKTVGNGEK